MASPVVETTAESAETSGATTLTLNYPSSIASGDLLIAIVAIDGNATTVSDWGGFTEFGISAASTDFVVRAAYKDAAGTESGTFNITVSASEKAAAIIYRISGAEDPATQPPEDGNALGGAGAHPNPPNIAPTGGSKDYLFIAGFGQSGEEADDDTWTNSAPTNYTNLLQKTSGTGGAAASNVSLATAQRQLTASSENPDAFSVDDNTLLSLDFIIAVHPGSGSTTLTGTTVTATPTLPVGDLNINVPLAGTLVTVTPSLPAGAIRRNLAGTTITATPTLPAGTIQRNLAGALITVTPTLPAGDLNVGVSLGGATVTATPSLPAGSVAQQITGVTITATPTLPAGDLNINVPLAGVTVTATPTLPTGSISFGTTITGVTVTATPTLPAGSIQERLSGTTITATPSLPAATIQQRFAGALITVTPTLPAGDLNVGVLLAGALVTATPTLPTGSVSAEEGATDFVVGFITF